MVESVGLTVFITILVGTIVGVLFYLKEWKNDKKYIKEKDEHINELENTSNKTSEFGKDVNNDSKKTEEKPKIIVKRDPYSLSQEEIDDIHRRGKITSAEKVKEYEDMGLCAPGDAIGSAAWRCDKFENCHDCLVDYVSGNIEYESFESVLKSFDMKKFMDSLNIDFKKDLFI